MELQAWVLPPVGGREASAGPGGRRASGADLSGPSSLGDSASLGPWFPEAEGISQVPVGLGIGAGLGCTVNSLPRALGGGV